MAFAPKDESNICNWVPAHACQILVSWKKPEFSVRLPSCYHFTSENFSGGLIAFTSWHVLMLVSNPVNTDYVHISLCLWELRDTVELVGASRDSTVWCNGRGPHLEWTQEPQASSPFLTRILVTQKSWVQWQNTNGSWYSVPETKIHPEPFLVWFPYWLEKGFYFIF